MSITQIRQTVLQTINETRTRRNLNIVASVSSDSDSIAMLSYLNDVVSFVSDQGDWLEAIDRVTVTASTSVDLYSVVGSAVLVKNIHDMYFADSKNEMKNIGYDQMRRNKIGANTTGQCYQYALWDTDANGNPQIMVYPTPSSQFNNETFNITVFVKPPLYTGADTATLIPFDSRIILQGLMALAMLDESTGAPSNHYQVLAEVFKNTNWEAYTRFKGNTGNEFYLMPNRNRFSRRRGNR